MPKKAPRKVLVILSDRLNRQKKPRHFELLCKPDGTILKETLLKRLPTKPAYEEVWQNDEGKPSLATCTRMSRMYRHPLEKSASGK
jgi:hypothetical protein